MDIYWASDVLGPCAVKVRHLKVQFLPSGLEVKDGSLKIKRGRAGSRARGGMLARVHEGRGFVPRTDRYVGCGA